MSTSDMKKAREWAEDVRRIEAEYGSARPDALAGARIIESLPDQWIDVQKLEKLLTVWRSQLEECDHADGHTVMITCINDLAFEIPTPPTLADITPVSRLVPEDKP